MKGMVWIQLSPVAGNQADQLNSGNFLLSLVEKLSLVITVWVSQLQQESPWAPIRWSLGSLLFPVGNRCDGWADTWRPPGPGRYWFSGLEWSLDQEEALLLLLGAGTVAAMLDVGPVLPVMLTYKDGKKMQMLNENFKFCIICEGQNMEIKTILCTICNLCFLPVNGKFTCQVWSCFEDLCGC